MSWRGVSKRVRSPSSAMVVIATVNCTPRSACSASTTGVQSPCLRVLEQLVLQALEQLGPFVDGPDVFLKDDLLRRRGEHEPREPAQMLRAPVRPPGVADIVAQQQGLQAEACRVQIVERIFPGARQIADRFIRPTGGTYTGVRSPARSQARERDGIPLVGLHPIARLAAGSARGRRRST